MEREFKPMVIETKEQLLTALKNGKLKSSKYNLLSEEEKLFVEMVVFGDYTAEQATKAIYPKNKTPRAIANRIVSNPDVADALEELSVQKNKKFMAEISSAQTMALAKLKYIMNTTKDEAVAAACAKTILDKAEKALLIQNKQEEGITDIKFKIQVDNIYNQPVNKYNPEDKVIIDVPSDQEQKVISDQYDRAKVNPETGLKYSMSYEMVDNYNDDEE